MGTYLSMDHGVQPVDDFDVGGTVQVSSRSIDINVVVRKKSEKLRVTYSLNMVWKSYIAYPLMLPTVYREHCSRYTYFLQEFKFNSHF